jgi:hypothetical protein
MTMKFNKWIIGLAAVGAISLATAARAADAPPAASVSDMMPPLPANFSPTISHGISEIMSAVSVSGLSTATNYAVEPYLTYAPDAPNGNKIGGGVFIAYNLNDYASTGIGVDYLGQFSMVSANVQLKLPLHPLGFVGWTNVAVCPFAVAGLGKSLSGTSAGAIAITDFGAYVGVAKLWGGEANVGFCWGRWDNAGVYSGPRYHLFVGWSKGF